jgi:hypothetical protein
MKPPKSSTFLQSLLAFTSYITLTLGFGLLEIVWRFAKHSGISWPMPFAIRLKAARFDFEVDSMGRGFGWRSRTKAQALTRLTEIGFSSGSGVATPEQVANRDEVGLASPSSGRSLRPMVAK